MSGAPGSSAADLSAGISQIALDAAVETARVEGHAAGLAAAGERFGAILGADGIKGDSRRMAAALDLAVSSPEMSADAVTSFVTANVGADATDPAAAYEATRLAATGGRLETAGLAQPSGGQKAKAAANLNPGSIFDARRQQVRRA